MDGMISRTGYDANVRVQKKGGSESEHVEGGSRQVAWAWAWAWAC